MENKRMKKEFEIKALLKEKAEKTEEERKARFKAQGRDPGPPWNFHDNPEIVQFDREVSTNNDNCTCPLTIFHGSALAISLTLSFVAFVCFFFLVCGSYQRHLNSGTCTSPAMW